MPDFADLGEGVLRLVAPARPESVDLVHDLVAQLSHIEDPPDSHDLMRFEMAVIEVIGNIVEHAVAADPPDVTPRRFQLILDSTPAGLEARFCDDGQPAEVDLEAVTMPDPLEGGEGGRGLALAMAAVDEVSYHRTGGINCWRLVCARS